MNKISAIGKFLDQPRLVGKFSHTVPAILVTGGAMTMAKQTKHAPQKEKKDEFIRTGCVLAGAIGSALISTRGIKPLKIGNKQILKGFKGLSEQINLNELVQKNTKLVDDFLKNNAVTEKTSKILNKSKNKILHLGEVQTIYNELSSQKNGKELLNKLIPDPENITSKQIFKEIKRLSLMGLVPVLGGITGGIIGDKLTDKEHWKQKVPNKIKEGTFQYLANIFMCNVGAGIALGIMEKANIKSKAARAIGMISGIITTGVIGGSAIANYIGKKVINPILHEKTTDKNIYSERKPELLDLGLHIDDIATVAVLSGLKWIEPALPALYSISGYRAGIGYRNGNTEKNI